VSAPTTAHPRDLLRGRPRLAQQAPARTIARPKQRLADLFENRHRFVRHKWTARQKKLLWRWTRDLPPLRMRRQIMDEVDRLFDRLPDIHGAGAAGEVAAAGASLEAAGSDAGQAEEPAPGEGVGIPG
jgi:hypothetical protein